MADELVSLYIDLVFENEIPREFLVEDALSEAELIELGKQAEAERRWALDRLYSNLDPQQQAIFKQLQRARIELDEPGILGGYEPRAVA